MIALVINLARAPERWASMARQAAERGLAIERLEAVDGHDPAALAASSAAPDSGLRPGEIACFESHRAAWRRIADGDAPFGLVLEDDVFLGAGAAPRCSPGCPPRRRGSTSSSSTPTRAACSSTPCRSPGWRGAPCVRPAQGTSDSSAYVISRSFAARALAIHDGYTPAARPRALRSRDRPGDRPGRPGGHHPAALRRLPLPRRGRARRPTSSRTGPRTARPRVHPLAAARREAARVWRRRIVPAAQPLLNLVRAPEDRRAFRRIAFDG